MPNICYAEIQVTGRKECIEEFGKILKAHYNYDTNEFSHKPHFWRVFDVYEDDMRHIEGLIYTEKFTIDCAWSIETCMTNSPFGYNADDRHDPDKEYFGTTLDQEAKRLKLDIEIWSSETGMEFTEHVHYRDTEELDRSCQGYDCYYIDDYEDYEDFVDESAPNEMKVRKDVPEEKFYAAKKNGEGVIELFDARNPFQFKADEEEKYNPFSADFKKVMCKEVKTTKID